MVMSGFGVIAVAFPGVLSVAMFGFTPLGAEAVSGSISLLGSLSRLGYF